MSKKLDHQTPISRSLTKQPENKYVDQDLIGGDTDTDDDNNSSTVTSNAGGNGNKTSASAQKKNIKILKK